MTGFRYPHLLAAAMAGLLMSCQSGTATVPAPDIAPQSLLPREDALELGSVHLTLDTATGEVDVADMRLNAAVGDAYLVGLNDLKRQFKVTSIKREVLPETVRLTLATEFAHPFSAATRPDLMGWDLKAILATDLNATRFDDASMTLPAGVLSNAAGYTTEWSPEINAALPSLTSNCFPFIILGEDRTSPDPFDFQDPAGYNCFPPGQTVTGDLVLDLPPATIIDMDVFFTVGFQVSATKATRMSPEYTPPRGNSRAPWRVEATIASNNLTGAIGSSADLDLAIWDWQHGLPLQSDIVGMTLYAPELSSTPVIAPVTGGSGRGTDPAISSGTITNDLGTIAGTSTWALVEVEDALSGQNPGGGVGYPGVDVLEDDFVTTRNIDDFRTFQVILLPLTPGVPGVDPVACVTSTPPMSGGSLTVAINTPVNWDASCSSDADPTGTPEGTIVAWEWDTDWDGIAANFVDETGGTGTALLDKTYLIAGDTHLGLRVTDGVGRVSPILDVPVHVVDRLLTLTLDPIADIQLPPWLSNDQRESGACFAELTNGQVELNYSAEEPSPPTGLPGYTAYQMTSYYTPGSPGTWSMSGSDLGSSGGDGFLEYGFWLKNCTNWGPSGEGIVMWGFSNRDDHSASEVLLAHNVKLGTLALLADLDATIDMDFGHCFDIASSRVDGSIYSFTAPFTHDTILRCTKGGPDLAGTPQADWRILYTGVEIDTRPSRVSHAKSVDAGAAGDLHIAYTAEDYSSLSYARNGDGTGANWTITDLDTGDFGDPTFDLDEAGTGAYIAVVKFGSRTPEIWLYISDDRGLTWNPGVLADLDHEFIQELSLNAFEVESTRVIAIGYSTGATIDDPGETRVAFTDSDGLTWYDQLLSERDNSYWPETFVDRETPDFFAAWSKDDRPNFQYLQAVHGVFAYQ